MKSAVKKLCIIFVEGDTEKVFYERLITMYRSINQNIICKIIINNISGIGKFQKKLFNRYKNNFRIQYRDYEHYIFLTYDTDAFEYSAKPPINWKNLENDLSNNGAKKVFHIRAEKSIEDWFLIDKEGICKNLRIPLNTKISGDSGFKKINSLFKKANKVYSKGKESTEVISKLDIEKIRNKVSNQLKDLENFLGIN